MECIINNEKQENMRKHFTAGQIKWIVIICLSIELLTNFDDAIRGFKQGWNSVVTSDSKIYNVVAH